MRRRQTRRRRPVQKRPTEIRFQACPIRRLNLRRSLADILLCSGLRAQRFEELKELIDGGDQPLLTVPLRGQCGPNNADQVALRRPISDRSCCLVPRQVGWRPRANELGQGAFSLAQYVPGVGQTSNGEGSPESLNRLRAWLQNQRDS